MAHGTFDSADTKGWLTTLPVIATVSSSLLSKLGAREMEQIREVGRQQTEYLLDTAKVRVHSATTDAQRLELLEWLIEETERIDVDQHRKHHQVSQTARKELKRN